MDSEEPDCGCIKRRNKSEGRSSTLIPRPTNELRKSAISQDCVRTFMGKRALVIGASRGIGRSVAKNLYFRGASVVAVARSDADLETLASEIPEIELIELDITKWMFTERKLNNLGDVDLLVHCAGISYFTSVLNTMEEEFDEMFDVNTKSVINITRIVASKLIKRKAPGSFVFITSQAGSFGMKRQGVFGASKAAVESFMKSAALELAPYNIRVNCVSPTVILTKTARRIWGTSRESKPLLTKIPMKRFGEIHEIVQAIIFLLGDKSRMITGTTLPVDGGFSAC